MDNSGSGQNTERWTVVDHNLPNVEKAKPPKVGTGTPNVVGAGALRPHGVCAAVSDEEVGE